MRRFCLQWDDEKLSFPSGDTESSSVRAKSLRSCLTLCDTTRLLCPWDSPGKNTGVGCHSFLQGIFPTQGWNPCLLNCRCILYTLSHVEEQPERLRDLASLLLSLTLPFQHKGMHRTPLCPVSGRHPSSKIQNRAEGAWRNWFNHCPPFHHPNPFS